MLTGVQTVEFELRFLPNGWACPDTSSGRLEQSPHIWFWKESEAWSNTERRPDGLLRRLDGCKLEQKLLDTEEGPDEWCFSLSGVRMVWQVVWTAGSMDRWASGRDDTSSRRLARNRLFCLANSAESSETLLNSGIPIKKHIYIKVILSKQNVANHNLTICLYMIESLCMISAKFSCGILMIDSYFPHAMKMCTIQGSPTVHHFPLWLLASGNYND
jgi:hypothetical protein